MAKGQYKKGSIKSSGEHGQYKKADWLNESQLHLLSAKMLRECSAEKKERIKKQFQPEGQSKSLAGIDELISQREAAIKSSILIIGYAFEMLLKSGLVCLYDDVPRKILGKDLRVTYGHNLRLIAEEIEVPINDDDLVKLKSLSDWLTGDARYPIEPTNERNYTQRLREVRRKFWDDEEFADLLQLYHKINSFVSTIDASEDDPKSIQKWEMDDGGFIIYRTGGKLKNRIIVKYSKQQKEKGEDNKDSLRALLPNIVKNSLHKQYLSDNWDTIKFMQIGVDRLRSAVGCVVL